MITPDNITGLVLAGGRGLRMGGTDKGLQVLASKPLALHALERLRPQVGALLVNANRNTAAYATFGVPVCPDTVEGFAGPLAGFLAGLAQCRTPWLLTVPCDSPRFPTDLATRLAAAALSQDAEIAIALATDHEAPDAAPSPCSACCAPACRTACSALSPKGAARLVHGRRCTAAPPCHSTNPVMTRTRSSTPTHWMNCAC